MVPEELGGGDDDGGEGAGSGFCAKALGAKSPIARASSTRMRLGSVTYPFPRTERLRAPILGCELVQVNVIYSAGSAVS